MERILMWTTCCKNSGLTFGENIKSTHRPWDAGSPGSFSQHVIKLLILFSKTIDFIAPLDSKC
jgi:hypothetical protein